ncbi:MAG: DUF1127 domain-containing protein [Sulfitobacter sp.]
MATTILNRRLDVFFDAGRTFIQQKNDQLRDALAKRRVYNSTYGELSKLSNRELADLGIARSNIRRMALEAAYGC